MKKVWVSDKTPMVLESIDNIDVEHELYDSFYEKGVKDNFHVHVNDNANVYDNAEVYGNAKVYDNVEVRDNAKVSGNSRVYDNAVVTKDTINIIGLPFNVTLTDNHIHIGCKQFTFEHAKRIAERNIDIDGDGYEKIIKHKDLLLALIRENEK